MEFAHYDNVIHNSAHKQRQVELVYSNSHITKVWIRCDKHGKYSFPEDKKNCRGYKYGLILIFWWQEL